MRYTLLCALLLPPLLTAAQDPALLPDNRKDLRAATNDTARAEALARLCFNSINSDPDSARWYGDRALALAERIKNDKALGDAHNNIGWLFAQQGKLDSAEAHLNKALTFFQRTGKQQYIAVTLSNLGWVANNRGDQVQALQHFQASMRANESAGDSAGMGVAYYSIGTTYRRAKDLEHALENLEHALAIERALGRTQKIAFCLQAIANVYNDRGEVAKALPYYEEAFRTHRSRGDIISAGIVQENIGDMYSDRDKRTALAHYDEALVNYDSAHSDPDRAYVLRRIGRMHTGLAELKEAHAAFDTGRGLAVATGSTELVMEYELALAELARADKDAPAVFAHYERYLAMKDSLQGEDTQKELARLRTEFETERKEKDNQLLRAQNNEQQERIRRGELQLYGSIALAVLALIGALLLWRNYTQKRRHAQVLEGLNKQLANSNAEITEINGLLEMKLLRSQMNPHFIYNCLNSAARMTQAGKHVEALAYLQGFARLLRMVLDHSVNDRVGIQEEMDFLRQYLKLEAQRVEGLNYTVDADRALLDDDVELPALIVQPFVENAVWHGLADKSGERTINVRFSASAQGTVCTITDNGVGRAQAAAALTDRDPTHRSLGMQLTSERLKLLSRRLTDDGAIAVEDLKAPDGSVAGTRVTIALG